MTETIDGVAYITATEAAAELSTTETRVLMLLKHKALQGTLFESGWLITRDSVDCLERHHLDPQLQSSCRSSCNGSSCGCH